MKLGNRFPVFKSQNQYENVISSAANSKRRPLTVESQKTTNKTYRMAIGLFVALGILFTVRQGLFSGLGVGRGEGREVQNRAPTHLPTFSPSPGNITFHTSADDLLSCDIIPPLDAPAGNLSFSDSSLLSAKNAQPPVEKHLAVKPQETLESFLKSIPQQLKIVKETGLKFEDTFIQDEEIARLARELYYAEGDLITSMQNILSNQDLSKKHAESCQESITLEEQKMAKYEIKLATLKQELAEALSIEKDPKLLQERNDNEAAYTKAYEASSNAYSVKMRAESRFNDAKSIVEDIENEVANRKQHSERVEKAQKELAEIAEKIKLLDAEKEPILLEIEKLKEEEKGIIKEVGEEKFNHFYTLCKEALWGGIGKGTMSVPESERHLEQTVSQVESIRKGIKSKEDSMGNINGQITILHKRQLICAPQLPLEEKQQELKEAERQLIVAQEKAEEASALLKTIPNPRTSEQIKEDVRGYERAIAEAKAKIDGLVNRLHEGHELLIGGRKRILENRQNVIKCKEALDAFKDKRVNLLSPSTILLSVEDRPPSVEDSSTNEPEETLETFLNNMPQELRDIKVTLSSQNLITPLEKQRHDAESKLKLNMKNILIERDQANEHKKAMLIAKQKKLKFEKELIAIKQELTDVLSIEKDPKRLQERDAINEAYTKAHEKLNKACDEAYFWNVQLSIAKSRLDSLNESARCEQGPEREEEAPKELAEFVNEINLAEAKKQSAEKHLAEAKEALENLRKKISYQKTSQIIKNDISIWEWVISKEQEHLDSETNSLLSNRKKIIELQSEISGNMQEVISCRKAIGSQGISKIFYDLFYHLQDMLGL